jgi:hypothetical protein
MTWPRGRYNGARIVGMSVKVVIDVTRWRIYLPSRYARGSFWIGPVGVYINLEYEIDRKWTR